MENEPLKSNDAINQTPTQPSITPAPATESVGGPNTNKTIEKITDVNNKTITSSKTGPSAVMLTVVLGIIAVFVLAGIYFYIQSTQAPTQINVTVTTSPETSATSSASPSASSTSLESEGAAIDADIENIESGTKDIDAGLNDQQGDLAE